MISANDFEGTMKIHRQQTIRTKGRSPKFWTRNILLLDCLILMLLAGVLLSTALTLHYTLQQFDEFIYVYTTFIVQVLFVVSPLLAAVAATGCIGAFRQDIVVLEMFTVAVGILFFVTFATTITLLALSPVLDESVYTAFNQRLDFYASDPAPIDFVQRTLECCGSKVVVEWLDLAGYVPASCCPRRPFVGSLRECQVPEDLLFISTRGCVTALQRLPDFSLGVISGVMYGTFFLEAIGFGFSIHLLMFLERSQNERIKKELAKKKKEKVIHLP